MSEPLFSLIIEDFAPDGSYVRGWASVTSIDGHPVVDFEGDIIPIDVLRDAVYSFIGSDRVALVQHDGKTTGAVVESVIIDDYFAKAHGIAHGKRGWWIGMEVYSAEARKSVVDGKLRHFSIGGTARKIKVAEPDL